MDKSSDNKTFLINYDQVVNDKSMHGTTRLLAVDLQKTGYINLANFFESITDSDLHSLIQLSESPDSIKYGELLLLAEMLALGEGLDSTLKISDENDVILTHRIQSLVVFLTCESLARKGLIKFHRDNISFGDDMATKTLVERIEDAE